MTSQDTGSNRADRHWLTPIPPDNGEQGPDIAHGRGPGITWDIADRSPTADVTIPAARIRSAEHAEPPLPPAPAGMPSLPFPPAIPPTDVVVPPASIGPAPRRQIPKGALIAAAATAAAGTVAAIGVIFWPDSSGSGERTPQEQAAPPPAAINELPPRDPAADAQLMAMLSAGHTPQNCALLSPGHDVQAAAACDATPDNDGPAAATYQLLAPEADIESLLFDSIAGSTIVDCPGRIQSPGPWRRNASLDQVAGTLVCAADPDHNTVAWTDTARRLVIIAKTNTPDPAAVAALYRWWTTHS